MLALTYMSKAQYRDIRNSAQGFDIAELIEKYGVCAPMKAQQYMIVDIIESAWAGYKALCKGHAPKDSDAFYTWMVEEECNVNGIDDTTVWAVGLKEANRAVRKFNKNHEYQLMEIEDNAFTRATLYTHIKAKIGDWAE